MVGSRIFQIPLIFHVFCYVERLLHYGYISHFDGPTFSHINLKFERGGSAVGRIIVTVPTNNIYICVLLMCFKTSLNRPLSKCLPVPLRFQMDPIEKLCIYFLKCISIESEGESDLNFFPKSTVNPLNLNKSKWIQLRNCASATDFPLHNIPHSFHWKTGSQLRRRGFTPINQSPPQPPTHVARWYY